jgi:FtsP/CotA-like multicopper oxidase with cupredoxin domain
MRHIRSFAKNICLLFLSCSTLALVGMAQVSGCPTRPAAGSVVADPQILSSTNGALTLTLTIANSVGSDGIMKYCYLFGDGTSEAPTLMVNPGDVLTINLINSLTSSAAAEMPPEFHIMAGMGSSACGGGNMTSSASNIHFHGLNIPPVCHQDDVISTSVAAGSPPFQYKITIPSNEPPGLYWYHPHPMASPRRR